MHNNSNILATAELPQPVIIKLAAAGMHVDVVPFIKTAALPHQQIAAAIAPFLNKQITAVFTSAKAVAAIAPFVKNIKWDFYCISGNTCRAVAQHFVSATVKGVATHAAALADILVGDKPQTEVVFFCGNRHRDELPAILKHASVPVQEVVVYETIILEQDVPIEYDAILFFSPSGVEGYFESNSVKKETVLFAIGNTTANAIKQYSTNKIIVATHPDKQTIATDAIAYFTEVAATK